MPKKPHPRYRSGKRGRNAQPTVHGHSAQPTDFTSLSLDDALEDLIAGGKKALSTRGRGRNAQPTPPKRTTRPPLKLIESPQWVETAVILYEHHTQCNTCGATYTYPGGVMIERRHPTLGKHLVNLRYLSEQEQPPVIVGSGIDALPHHTLQVHDTTPTCSRCFDLINILEGALASPPSVEMPSTEAQP